MFNRVEERIAATADLLKIAKEEMQAQSEAEGSVVEAGSLKDLAPSLPLAGNISPNKRLESGDLTSEDCDVLESNLCKMYVPVSVGAPIRCGDGRIINGYDPEDAEDYGRALGPQLFGAIAGVAIAYRISIGGIDDVKAGTSICKDIEDVTLPMFSAGFSAGAHTDTHSNSEKCGCGAIDTISQQFNRLSDANVIIGSQELSKARLGDRYNQADFDFALKNALDLRTDEEKYRVPSQQIIDQVRELNAGSVEQLDGVHNEILLSVNGVKGTTLHRDEAGELTGGKAQSFNTDDWAIWDIAAELFPDDKEMQSVYAHSFMLKDAITLPGLIHSDGSIKVFVRTPN